MDEVESPLRPDERLTLREFAVRFVAGERDIDRLEQLQGERPPKRSRVLDRERHVYPSLDWEYKDVIEPPTPGYEERQVLQPRIESDLRSRLSGSSFVCSGRRANGVERISIDPRTWASIPIDFSIWAVGSGTCVLRDVLVESAPKGSDDERLYDFILTCMIKLTPGAKLVKPTIRKLAESLEGYEVTTPMFLRAWERAAQQLPPDLAKAWTRGGRR